MSKAELRRMKTNGLPCGRLHRTCKPPGSIDVWKKQVMRYFRTHSWTEASSQSLECSRCGAVVSYSQSWSFVIRAKIELVIRNQRMGWMSKNLHQFNCDELMVEKVQTM